MTKVLSKSAFEKRVKDAIKHYDMLSKGDRVLVAVSGGADSVCLLRGLLAIKKSVGIDIVVANMDHCIRGEESKKDSTFVKQLADELGLEFVYAKINVVASRSKKNSLEEAAREKRYSFLKREALKNKCNVIATGHNMNDQAETLLIRFIHGSSLSGLTGIPPLRKDDTLSIIRPLIRVSRKEILGYLKGIKQGFVVDSTNENLKYVRNRIRHEALPFLEKYNPKLKRSLSNLADTLREDFSYINSEKALGHGKKSSKDRIKIRELVMHPVAIRKQLFKELFKNAGGNVKRLTYRHWMDMDYFLRTAEKGKSLDFPGKIRVSKKKDEIVFTKISS